MWMILRFPDKLRHSLTLFGCFALMASLFTSCHPQEGVYIVPQGPDYAHDAPRPAKLPTEEKPAPIDNSQLRRPVELKSVSVRKLDSKMAELAGAQFLKAATDPIVIMIQARYLFDPLPRTSSPVIVLNGRKLMNTRGFVGASDKLVAFLPDRSLIKDINTVRVFWVGNEELTTTKRPLTFRVEDIGN